MKIEKCIGQDAKDIKGGYYDYRFFCPGCNYKHGFMVTGNTTWQFNNDLEKPTVSPSILHTVDFYEQGKKICHSFIKEGKIQYLSDCTHKLAGQTIELPEL